MDLSEATLLERLEKVRPIKVNSTWVSATPFVELCRNNPPDWLYCSCKAARYNPKNIACVYFAQDGRTARAEHACNNGNDVQPMVFFSAKVQLRNAIDLTNSQTLKTLGLTTAQLFENWERKKIVATQLLGAAVAKHPKFSAIMFPSSAAREAGFRGKNIVIFRDSIRRPDFVQIIGPTKKPLQRWPC
ncbi:MAG TPA: RES family NAD+ phosphorylase [Verrucomicrobiae bacterium]|nr:RES family NAD+ phosphorylase [Verrucomicrobiae bacterium]